MPDTLAAVLEGYVPGGLVGDDVDVDLHVIYETDEDGWVRASIEELPGVITCAATLDDARLLVRDALTEWLAALTSDERAQIPHDATRETLTVSVA